LIVAPIGHSYEFTPAGIDELCRTFSARESLSIMRVARKLQGLKIHVSPVQFRPLALFL